MSRNARKPADTARPAGLRALVALIALLSLFAQGANFAHFLLVEHRVCPEHGELIHAGEPGHESERYVAQVPERDEQEYGVRTSAPDVGHGHEHCALLSDRRDRLALRSPSAVVVPRCEPELLVLTSASALLHAPAIRLLLLAPKNSPPA